MSYKIIKFNSDEELINFLDKNEGKIKIISIYSYSSKDWEWESSFNMITVTKVIYKDMDEFKIS